MKTLYLKFLLERLFDVDGNVNNEVAEELVDLLSQHLENENPLINECLTAEETESPSLFHTSSPVKPTGGISGKNTGLVPAIRELIVRKCPDILTKDKGSLVLSQKDVFEEFSQFNEKQIKAGFSNMGSVKSSSAPSPLYGLKIRQSWKCGFIAITWERK